MKTLIEMAREAGYTEGELAWHDEILERFAELVRADEREACAKVCEQRDDEGECPDQWDWHSSDYAAAIRARSNT